MSESFLREHVNKLTCSKGHTAVGRRGKRCKANVSTNADRWVECNERMYVESERAAIAQWHRSRPKPKPINWKPWIVSAVAVGIVLFLTVRPSSRDDEPSDVGLTDWQQQAYDDGFGDCERRLPEGYSEAAVMTNPGFTNAMKVEYAEYYGWGFTSPGCP